MKAVAMEHRQLLESGVAVAQSATTPEALLDQKYNEMVNELKQTIDLICGLNRYVVEEKDLNKVAKTVTNKISDITSIASGTTFTAKALYEVMIATMNKYREKMKGLADYCEQLRRDKQDLQTQLQSHSTCDASVNTDDRLLGVPDHIVLEMKQKVSMILSRNRSQLPVISLSSHYLTSQELEAMVREKELSDRLMLLARDRKLFKTRVQENHDRVLSLQEELRRLECIIAAKDVSGAFNLFLCFHMLQSLRLLL